MVDQSGPERWLSQCRTGGSAAPEYSYNAICSPPSNKICLSSMARISGAESRTAGAEKRIPGVERASAPGLSPRNNHVSSFLLKKLFECKEKIIFSPGRSVEVFHDAEIYTFLLVRNRFQNGVTCKKFPLQQYGFSPEMADKTQGV